MNLTSLALSITVQEMMMGRTYADLVLNHPLDPIGVIVQRARNSAGEPAKPVLAVYISESDGAKEGKDVFHHSEEIKLLVNAYLPPAAVKVEGAVDLIFDNTGSSMLLGMVGRQVDMALQHGNQVWIDIWRDIVQRMLKRTARFVLYELEKGVQIPCLEICYELMTISDPDMGKPIFGAWAKLDAALRIDQQDTQSIALADQIKLLIETPELDGLLPWELLQKNFGMTDAALYSTGLGPVTDDGSTPILEQVDAPPDITIVPPGRGLEDYVDPDE